jgi:hypothetical protein
MTMTPISSSLRDLAIGHWLISHQINEIQETGSKITAVLDRSDGISDNEPIGFRVVLGCRSRRYK